MRFVKCLEKGFKEKLKLQVLNEQCYFVDLDKKFQINLTAVGVDTVKNGGSEMYNNLT